jgi:exonuclease VII small subunit
MAIVKDTKGLTPRAICRSGDSKKLPACPKCGNRVSSTPTRTYTVLVESERTESGFTAKKLASYTCSKCNTKFPIAVDRQHYLVVPADVIKRMENDVRVLQMHNEMFSDSLKELTRGQQELKSALKSATEDSELRDLEGKLKGLERHVEHLKRDKVDLEHKLSGTIVT